MTDEPEDNENDEIIWVRLPRKDYVVLRQMIDDQNAMAGVKRWFHKWGSLVFWTATGALSVIGLYNFFKDFPR